MNDEVNSRKQPAQRQTREAPVYGVEDFRDYLRHLLAKYAPRLAATAAALPQEESR